MIDLSFRADSEAFFNTYAMQKGWLTPRGLTRRGVDIDRIGAVVRVPAVLKKGATPQETVVLEPTKFEPFFYVNVRLHGRRFDEDRKHTGTKRYDRSDIVRTMKAGTIKEGRIRTYRVGRVDLVDPETVAIPVRVWAGEMYF